MNKELLIKDTDCDEIKEMQTTNISNYDTISKILHDSFSNADDKIALHKFMISLADAYPLFMTNMSDMSNISDKNQEKEVKSNENEVIEPLLDPRNHKFTAFPIKYHDIWEQYKNQVSCYWKEEEIDFANDYTDFMSLNDNEKYFVEMILAFFAASDGIVNFNLSERFTREIQVTEALFAYQFQIMMENVHSIVYSKMLDNIVKDPVRRDMLFNAITTVPAVKMMADWAFEWIDSSESFAHRLIAFAIVEGIFFSGAFAAIFWLKKYKQKASSKPFMEGLVKSNKFISRDEGLHYTFACVLYKHIKNKLSQTEVNKMVSSATLIAQNFITEAIPCRLIGMNSELMNQYIEYIADILLNMLGYKKLYNKANPFKFMESISLNDKTNFFDQRAHEYPDAHVMNKKREKKIVLKDNF